MRKVMTLVSMFVFVLSGAVTAHEGHDHSPGLVQAPHGGMIQKVANQYYVEVQGKGDSVKVYPLTLEMKPIPLSEISVTATSQAPKKRNESMKLSPTGGDAFEGTVKTKGLHRYKLELAISHKGKKELLTFQIEPQG